MLSDTVRRPSKRQRRAETEQDLAPIVFVYINDRRGKKNFTPIKALLDSGASATLVSESVVKKLKIKTTSTSTTWTTAGGTLSTNKACDAQFMLPELSNSQTVDWRVHLKPKGHSDNYDMIIGRDLLKVLNIQLSFADSVIRMKHAEIPMRPRDATLAEAFLVHTADKSDEELNSKYSTILDADYKKADLPSAVEAHDHLTRGEKAELLQL